MPNYIPLHCHSHYSLLDGLSKPAQIASRLDELGINTGALTDHGNISGSVSFVDAMEQKDKQPLLGCELYICNEHATNKTPDNSKLQHLPIIAKNDSGWKQLVKLTSASNFPEHFYHKPRLALDQLGTFVDGDLMAFSGHLGSHISNSILQGTEKPVDGWQSRGRALAEWFRDTFGKENFYLEVQLMDRQYTPLQEVVAECVRAISKQTNIPCVATPDAHYARKEDALDQRILICTNLRKTLTEMYDGGLLKCFFNSNNFHIPSYEEMIGYGHTEEELENTVNFASAISKYEHITGPPILPPFPCPKGMNEEQYLRQLCRDGFLEKVRAKGKDESLYGERADLELNVFGSAGISGYFLIVADILNYCSNNNWLVGPGRGSAAGCLVSYLTHITQIDPIPYGLWFERFYNAGRNTGGRVSMPDIDIDVPVHKREAVINYIKNKYGHNKVSQMITFQTMKGRGALKDVLRAHGGVPFEMMNEMTKNLPEEAKISGELQTMKEARGESSIIVWALENMPDRFKEWVTLEDDGTLTGDYAQRFEQAIRLEGTKSAQSKHAAGLVIAPEPLSDICPMVLDNKTKQMVAGLEMYDLESIGMLKFDILGVAMLDKVMGVQQILETGDILE